jgi:cell division protein FtsL
LGSLLFLLLAVGYVAERSHAVQLNRRLFELQERAMTLRTEVELLGAEATRLADRHRILRAAESLGMRAPESGAVEYIYYVSDDADRPGESAARLTPE